MSQIKGYLTLTEFGAAVKLTRQRLWQLIMKKRIKAIHIGSQVSYLIPESELKNFKPGKSGRPKKVKK